MKGEQVKGVKDNYSRTGESGDNRYQSREMGRWWQCQSYSTRLRLLSVKEGVLILFDEGVIVVIVHLEE